MKKKSIAALLCLMILSVFTLTGCEKDSSVYGKTKMDKYVTLPDYDSFTIDKKDIKITKAEIEAEIENRIAQASTETKKITKGTVEKGDKINISFEGTLDDGTTSDGMKSDNFPLVLGDANMIEGFQEGLYGAKIGETVTLKLRFPKNYGLDQKLSNKKVTFKVKVLNKEVPIKVEYDEEFIKKDSNNKATNKKEYEKYIKKTLADRKKETVKKEEQRKLFQQIVEKAEVKELLEEQVKAVNEKYTKKYHEYAKENNLEWADFLKTNFGWSEKEFKKNLKEFAEANVRESMIIYAIAQKEGVVISDDEYKEKLNEVMNSLGYKNEEDFKKAVGTDLEEYGDMYSVRLNAMMDEAMEIIYNRLTGEKK